VQQWMDATADEGFVEHHAWLTPEQFGKKFGQSDAGSEGGGPTG